MTYVLVAVLSSAATVYLRMGAVERMALGST